MPNTRHEYANKTQALGRRSFLAASSVMAGSISGVFSSTAAEAARNDPPVVLFSKHLGWTNYDELAGHVAEMGFDGVDLTVRPGGHVLPERVEDDLPKAAEAIRKAGSEINMITTGISNPGDPVTEKILKTASALKIPYYRIGSWRYQKDGDLIQQLKEWNAKLKVLALMNQSYNICAGYHNHSGEGYIGGSMWDVHLMLEGIDSKWVGSNFDPGHAVAEGGSGAWATMFRLIGPKVRGSAIKDVTWEKSDKGWRRGFPAVGEGMVDWPRVLSMFKQFDFTGPMSMHFEYDMKGKNEAETRKIHVASIKRDLDVFTQKLKDAGLRA